MKIIRAKEYKDMSRKAANIISAQVIMKPNCVLGLATGGTPVGAYAQLVDWYNKGDLDLIELQKEYAKELLCHVNPYTGLALIDDPAVVTIQINNEDTAIKGNMGDDAGEESKYSQEFLFGTVLTPLV